MSQSSTLDLLHPTNATQTFVTVVLPFAIPKPYTYEVPEELIDKVQFGLRAEVQFGKNKIYSALIIDVHNNAPEHRAKPILSLMDEAPIVNATQLKLWLWMAEYYHCTLGEVMDAALPTNLKLASEKRLVLSPLFDGNFEQLNDSEYLIAEALTIQEEITVGDVQKILNRKTVYPVISRLLEKKVIFLFEDLQQKYTPKKIQFVRFMEPYRSEPARIEEAFELCNRSMRQAEAIMGFVQLSRNNKEVRKSELYKTANIDSTVLKALHKKDIFEIYEKEISRVGGYEDELTEAFALSEQQVNAIEGLKQVFEEKNVALLHGVTGSGKTRVYIELIKEAIDRGEQVLYLLPEVALTAQIINRLQKIFGDDIAVYHHRISNNERVDLWKEVLNGKAIVLGARSGVFMPFNNLGLVIVDEEHDTSYKQSEPAPRYHGRDTAVYLAHLHRAKVVLGTATPGIESYQNARLNKYGLVEMPERFGGLQLPEIIFADLRREMKERKLQSHFSSTLLDELKATLERGEQAILFQNRRGHSPSLRCKSCDWHAECQHCDVSLTYHKWKSVLNCHYCGYTINVHQQCPACGTLELELKGFGTEKIEDELKIYLPEAKIGRMDYDTVKSKNAAAKIINDFEERRIDILVGTKMVTKGLDFENVGLVGVLSADQLLQFPDFRASEQGYQLITQVAGRAGRKHKRGKVIIQAFNGAGDTKTPTYINFVCFWLLQLPFAYFIAITLNYGPIGVFCAITLAEILIAIIGIIWFKKGHWKSVKV